MNIAAKLAEISRNFYARGWVFGTSGNFSAVLSREPLRLLITSSGKDKGSLTEEQFLEVDGDGNVLSGQGKPSAETSLHLVIARLRGAGAILHTHSVWGTILSDIHKEQGGIEIEGFEMLKGLSGVTTHEHTEWLPIIENSQDYVALARGIETVLVQQSSAHAILLRRHGLYTWGRDIEEAKRHVEIIEFLFEVLSRKTTAY
jgi:methylthioribulose-1-phosphate dehydratase